MNCSELEKGDLGASFELYDGYTSCVSAVLMKFKKEDL